MKRPYSHKRNLPHSVWWFGGVVAIVLIIGAVRLLAPGAFFSLSSPLWNSGSSLSASTGSVFAGFGSNQKLASENKALIAKNEALTNQNTVLTARAQDLTKLLGGQENAESGIPAGVLARPPESPYDTLTVAEGSADGVAVGSEVYSVGGTPLGIIKHETAHTAQVSLFSTPGRETDGWAGSDRIPLTLVGQGGGSFTATVPKATAITVGEDVYVPGPGALPMGTISKVDVDPSSPNSVVHVTPLVNMFSVTWVEIAAAS